MRSRSFRGEPWKRGGARQELIECDGGDKLPLSDLHYVFASVPWRVAGAEFAVPERRRAFFFFGGKRGSVTVRLLNRCSLRRETVHPGGLRYVSELISGSS